MKRLLAALRFGNEKWNQSVLSRELENIVELEEIMEELKNLNGLGVLQNNHANLLRKMAMKEKDRTNDLLDQAENYYKLAIENALAQAENYYKLAIENAKITNKNDSSNSKVLSRRLGLALVYMDKSLQKIDVQTVQKTVDTFSDVISIYEKLEDWKGLANLGYVITSHGLQRKNPEILWDVVADANAKALGLLKLYLKFSGELIPSDHSAICKLCYNI